MLHARTPTMIRQVDAVADETLPPHRLCILTDTLRGGLGTVVRAQSAWFAAHGWQVVVAGPDDGPPPDPPARWIELPIVGSARHPGAVLRATRSLRRMWRAEGPWQPIVHVHGMRSLLLARLAGMPTPFVTVHGTGPDAGDPRGYDRVRRAWLGMVPRLAERAVTVEPGYGGRWVYEPHASPLLDRLEVLPFPDPTSVPTFGWLGLLDQRKQPEVFVRAIAAVAESGQAVVGLLAGSGPRSAELAALVADLAAPVEILGQADPVSVLRRSWAVGLFARSEGTPLAVMEAMWAGRAVIGSPVPGIEHLVGTTGYLAADVADAAGAMRALAADPALAAQRGAEAAARIRTLVSCDDPWPATRVAYVGFQASGGQEPPGP